jgi:hypothetical protein
MPGLTDEQPDGLVARAEDFLGLALRDAAIVTCGYMRTK